MYSSIHILNSFYKKTAKFEACSFFYLRHAKGFARERGISLINHKIHFNPRYIIKVQFRNPPQTSTTVNTCLKKICANLCYLWQKKPRLLPRSHYHAFSISN